jgi:hypothetical protein
VGNAGRGAGRPDPGRRPTKAERKEQARLERDAIQRRMAGRQRSRRNVAIVGGFVVVVAIAIAVLGGGDGTSEPSDAAEELPGMLTTSPPWGPNTEELGARLRTLDLPPEGVAQHLHVPVYVYVQGEPVEIPANVGVATDAVSPIHTHDAQGTVHVESAEVRDFTLGQFFDVWGVRLTGDCVGGSCATGDAAVRVFSGGEEVGGDPRDVVLEDTEAVVVTFGATDDVPEPMPTGFPTVPPAG